MNYTVAKTMLTIALAFLSTFASCTEIRQGVGMRGILVEKDRMTLDGDTVSITNRISESVMVIERLHDVSGIRYLIQQKSNGLYYLLVKGESVCAIDNTSDFVSIGNQKVYHICTGKSYTCPFDDGWGLEYVGQTGNLYAFSTYGTIWFTDGKQVVLQPNTFCTAVGKDGKLTLWHGAQSISMTLSELYRQKGTTAATRNVRHLDKSYLVTPVNEENEVMTGLRVRMDVPLGDGKSDMAIRNWSISAINADVFSLLGLQDEIPAARCDKAGDMESELDYFGNLWKKLYHCNYDDEEYAARMSCDILIEQIADNNDYVTYYYYDNLDAGGLHGLPRSYYITYDKRKNTFLTADNAIRPAMLRTFRRKMLDRLKMEYDSNYGEVSSWEDFFSSVASFHSPILDLEGLDDISRSFLQHDYLCDEEGGWSGISANPFTEEDFPLPHLAILPEGVVVTYHPYQIDCFASGEYHVLIPFKDIAGCLNCDYSNSGENTARIERFLKMD